MTPPALTSSTLAAPSSPGARVFFVSTLESLAWGGSEELWSQTALQLRAHGHAVDASVAWRPDLHPCLEALQRAGIALHLRRDRRRWQMILGEKYLARHTRALQIAAPDLTVISLDSQTAGLRWMEACRARGLPYALIVHAFIEHLWPGDVLNAPLAQGYRDAAKIFCVSQRNLESLRVQFAHDLPRAEVVRNPFNVRYQSNFAWPEDNSTLRLACVGRLDPVAKGHDLLFEVLRREKWCRRALRVSLFGVGGYEQSLRALVEYFDLGARVEFAGTTSDVQGIWEKHHALVLPSRSEGLPIVIVEAMLCGRPCIVTDVAGNAELLTDNQSGFVARAPHVDFLDEALERAWQSWQNGALQAVGQAAARQVRELIPRDPAAAFGDRIETLLTTI